MYVSAMFGLFQPRLSSILQVDTCRATLKTPTLTKNTPEGLSSLATPIAQLLFVFVSAIYLRLKLKNQQHEQVSTTFGGQKCAYTLSQLVALSCDV